MVTASILVFPDWSKEFHVHVDASSIALGAVLAQPGEGELDHPISFASRKLSSTKENYTTIEREGLAMVYVLQSSDTIFWDLILRCIEDHYALRYLVNKPVLGGDM
jgi:hypothetical protein